MAVRQAAPTRQKITPAFTVEEMKGETVEKVRYGTDQDGKRTQEIVKEPFGYLVKFPSKGHSIRVATFQELKRLGFHDTVPLVDNTSEDDEPVGTIPGNIKAA